MLNINRNTAGMVNNGQNLVDLAIQKAQSDHQLTAEEVQELRTVAESDGNVTGLEEAFLQDLEQSSTREVVSVEINDADFDPNTYEFVTEGRVNVNNGTREIEMEFTDAPSEAKQIKGDINEAKANMLRLIPQDQRREWARIDKTNVEEVSQFVNGLGLSTPQKAAFLESYMTAHFNHVGKNVEWNGADLQAGINAVPSDEHHRKYIDCEAYAEIGRSILGDEGFSPLSVSTTGPGQNRDHQVAVFRDGDDAYVLSNNEVTRVQGGASQDDNSLVQGIYPGFDDAVLDPNGAMLHDSTNYQVGNTETDWTDDDQEMTMTVTSIDGPLEITSRLEIPEQGARFHTSIEIDPETGEHTNTIDPQIGDVFPFDDDNARLTVSGENGYGLFEDDAGNRFHGRVVSSGTENKYKVVKELTAGDVLALDGGGSLNMDSANSGSVSLSDGSNYHVDVTVNASNGRFNTMPRFAAGDSFRNADANFTLQVNASDATKGVVTPDGGAPIPVNIVRTATGDYNFVPISP